MPEYTGRFIINSKILSTISRGISLPADTSSAEQFMSLANEEGLHGLFVVVKNVTLGLFYQFSLSIPYDTTGGSWYNVTPLEFIDGINKLGLDVKSDGLTITLRLRKVAGPDPVSCTVLLYNIEGASTAEDISVTETSASVTGSISSVTTPVNSGSYSNDHFSLMNIGELTHYEIDECIQKYSSIMYMNTPYTGIDLSDQIGNTVFNVHQISNTFAQSSLVLKINGMEQINGIQYTEDPDNGEFELDDGLILDPVDVVTVDFEVSEPIERTTSHTNINISDQIGNYSLNIHHIASEFIPGSLVVKINGIEQTRGVQYTEYPSDGEFTLNTGLTLVPSDILAVNFEVALAWGQ